MVFNEGYEAETGYKRMAAAQSHITMVQSVYYCNQLFCALACGKDVLSYGASHITLDVILLACSVQDFMDPKPQPNHPSSHHTRLPVNNIRTSSFDVYAH